MIPNKDFLILALDFDSSKSAVSFLVSVPEVQFVKIGMELFYSEGPSIFETIRKVNQDIRIFLDLKINDIPKTIEKTVKKLTQFPVDYITLFSGKNGIHAAVQGRGDSNLKILNVTVLTSEESSLSEVLNRAQMSYESGADGVICSGLETKQVREKVNSNQFIIVNPGVRLEKNSDDQIRTVTPENAWKSGATNIVVGRPITQAGNPRAVIEAIFNSIK
jgi:orotidine-5'-phosphate decarboxylase